MLPLFLNILSCGVSLLGSFGKTRMLLSGSKKKSRPRNEIGEGNKDLTTIDYKETGLDHYSAVQS